MPHHNLAAQPCRTASLIMTRILQHQTFQYRRLLTICSTTDQPCLQARTVYDGLTGLTDNRHTVLEHNRLVVHARGHNQRIAGCALLNTLLNRALHKPSSR